MSFKSSSCHESKNTENLNILVNSAHFHLVPSAQVGSSVDMWDNINCGHKGERGKQCCDEERHIHSGQSEMKCDQAHRNWRPRKPGLYHQFMAPTDLMKPRQKTSEPICILLPLHQPLPLYSNFPDFITATALRQAFFQGWRLNAVEKGTVTDRVQLIKRATRIASTLDRWAGCVDAVRGLQRGLGC